MSSLIDTDSIIDGLHGRPGVASRLERLALDGAAISVITLGELYEGAFSTDDPDTSIASMRRFVSGFQILYLNDRIMQRFAQERAALRRQGRLIADLDLLIAATALAHGLTLVTRNTRHFERVPDLRLVNPETN